MKKLKFIKGTLLTSMFGIVAVSVTSCTYTTPGTLTTYSATDYLTSNNSPLDPTFCNSPISTYALSEELGLVSYQTTGQYQFSDTPGDDGIPQTETTESINDIMILEGAKAVMVFKDEATKDAFDDSKNIDVSKDDGISSDTWLTNLSSNVNSVSSTTSSNTTNESDASTTDNTTTTTYTNGVDYWIFYRNMGGIQYQDNTNGPTTPTDLTETTYYENAISSGTIYQFLVDTDIPWVDSSGVVQTQVSSKDFERAVETYKLASDLNYNRNGYFLDLMGLDFDKTVGYSDSSGNSVDIDTVDYDVENYVNNNDNFFTLYIGDPYPYTFGLLAKDYFNAIPHTNSKVQTITLASTKYGSSPIAYDASTFTIDQASTDWSRIYGSGGLGVFTSGTWYAGAYYIAAFTSTQILFKLNESYMKTVGEDLVDYDTGKVYSGSGTSEDKIDQVLVIYGSGTTDTFYELFKSGQNDYLSAVPSAKMSEAAELYVGTSLVPYKTKQISQSNYIAYTPSTYIVDATKDSDGNYSYTVSENNYLGNAASFTYQWNSKDSTIIRAGIAGLINYYQLALLALPSSADFQLSATPYGVFENYYETVADGYSYGGLPRAYSDYKDSKDTTLGSFTIPYYDYTSSGINIEDVEVSTSSFQAALKDLGYSTSNPLNYSIKFGDGSWSTNYTAFLNALKLNIETISGGLINVTLNQRDATSPTSTEWYNSQSSPLGYSYWSPDYNGVGTWIEADTTLQTENGIEAVPETNSHNSFITFLSSMVTAVKLMGATWNDKTNHYEVTSLPTTDPFVNDEKIQKAFSNDTLNSMGIATSDETNTSNTYDESDATDSGMSPGIRYGLLAIGLLNKFFDEGVFKQDKFANYVSDPSKLVYSTSTPTTVDQVYIGNDIFNTDTSSDFSKWLGVYSGESTIKALYATTVLDSDYSYVPRAESGLNDIIYSLVNPLYLVRNGTQGTTYRDYALAS